MHKLGLGLGLGAKILFDRVAGSLILLVRAWQRSSKAAAMAERDIDGMGSDEERDRSIRA